VAPWRCAHSLFTCIWRLTRGGKSRIAYHEYYHRAGPGIKPCHRRDHGLESVAGLFVEKGEGFERVRSIVYVAYIDCIRCNVSIVSVANVQRLCMEPVLGDKEVRTCREQRKKRKEVETCSCRSRNKTCTCRKPHPLRLPSFSPIKQSTYR